ncbi:hypothetical protein HK104_009769 [Borealophlyctis nickersoniae]|nr:hypothetical protein HK104_009769 [Borealophlyctis nickersoniae]
MSAPTSHESSQSSTITLAESLDSTIPRPTFTSPADGNDLEKSATAAPSSYTVTQEAVPISPSVSRLRRYLLLSIFCCAQFLDIFNVSGVIIALTGIGQALQMTISELNWIVNAYALTFAAFLLFAGRVSDLYGPRLVFVLGFAIVGLGSLISGFSDNSAMIIVFRALSGIGASMTIPSATSLIVSLFPGREEQGMALTIFGMTGALGNVLGLIIGGILVDLLTWKWVFFLAAIISLPLSTATFFLLPRTTTDSSSPRPPLKRLDFGGTLILAVALILFVFALISGNEPEGWTAPRVLVTLVISGLLFPAFLVWEYRMEQEDAILPSATWFLPNFTLLFFVSLSLYFWWSSSLVSLTTVMQEVFRWSPLNTAVHFLPLGIAAATISILTPILSTRFHVKSILIAGLAAAAVGAALLAQATNDPGTYWPFMFTGMVVGSAGCSAAFVSTNIAMIQSAPPSSAGVVGGVFNSALQVGTALGVSVITAIASAVSSAHGHKENPWWDNGLHAAFWFVFAVMCAECVAVVVGFRK